MDALVSVIIPLYNAEKFVGQAINSIIAQTYKNWELIIVDDGSTDGSLAVAKGFENEQIRVFQQSNKGASSARNSGLDKANGAYIQFLDADDFLGPDKIKKQLELITGQEDQIALGPTVYFNHDDDPFSIPVQQEWFSAGSNDNVDFLIKLYSGQPYGGMIQPNAWLVPRTVINKAGYWNETLTLDDDGEFFCRVVLAGKGIKYTPESINYYRRFKTLANLSAQNNEKAFISAINATKLKHAQLQGLVDATLLNKIFSRLYWSIAIQLYPKQLKLYKAVAGIAKQLSTEKVKDFYTHTPFYRFTTRYFGWKTSAWFSFIKQSLKSG